MKVASVSARYSTGLFRRGEILGIKYLAAVLTDRGIEVMFWHRRFLICRSEAVVLRLQMRAYDLLCFSVMYYSASKMSLISFPRADGKVLTIKR